VRRKKPDKAPAIVARIKAIAMDVDGVLTDGGVWWGPNGEEWKRFHFCRHHGPLAGAKSGMVLALISGEASRSSIDWPVSLGSATFTRTARTRQCTAHVLGKARIAFAGDLLHWRRCKRFARAQHRRSQRLPADARPRFESFARWSPNHRRNGAVREVVTCCSRLPNAAKSVR